ncbi:hypothetical protein D0Z07_4597 [Hyphodiscus hymeniophilus]|uniref:Reticulon-like protein n=1 Tax=Hyphodiscus hymeniophilus TaxID=353542 RepID=A0A9P6VJV3_9HELO|nr:hypothetical protein D0Z07_4597 [Hyphodiscus hymeniophilus]
MSEGFVAPSIETSNGSAPSSLENAKNTAIANASAAANAVKDHPITQSVANGPVAENIKDQHAKTSNEFSNLAASRATPAQPAATGQQLTHYHSFFSTLLSWDNPRASGIAFLSAVIFIFAARYFNILRYAFKLTWMTLGVTVAAEVLGKAILGQGLSSQIRPKKYFTISKSTLDNLTGDMHELINFFVIESQRIVFAENVFASVAAFLGAFFSYYLIKFVPIWGLTLISTSILFLAPLIYKTNKELIDHHVNNASSIVNQQTEQVKQLASHHASRATETTKQYVGDYSAKAQEMIGNARARSTSPVASAKPAKADLKENTPAYKSEDFPIAPKEEFKAAPPVQETANALRTDEPLIST